MRTWRLPWCSVIAATVLLPGVARAQLLGGPEFQVNAWTTGNQFFPAIAASGTNTFMVVWVDDLRDGQARGVFARRLDAAGTPVGSDFQANTYTTGFQTYPVVAGDGAGNFVVVWDSFFLDQDGSGSGVFAQRFDGTGTPLGVEVQVNTYTTLGQYTEGVAADAAGNFTIAWTGGVGSPFGQGQDGSATGVFAQRYAGSGTPVGGEFQVNAYTTGYQEHAVVAAGPAGSFVVVWTGAGATDGSGVFARRYDGTGTPQGPEFPVNTYTTGGQGSPRVAADAAGNFVVVWLSADQDGDSFGIFGRRFDASGTPLGPEFQVNTYVTGAQFEPEVAADAAGNVLVVWSSVAQTPDHVRVYGRRYDASGAAQGQEFQVSTYAAGDQGYPAVAANPAGDFVVAWNSIPKEIGLPGQDGDGPGVFARRYTTHVPVTGTRVVLKDNANPARRSVLFRSRDPLLQSSQGAGLNPLVGGLALHVYNDDGTGDAACLPLPASGWVATGTAANPVYRYRDPHYVNGPCRAATFQAGLLLQVNCKATVQPIAYSLDEPAQTRVGVSLTNGTGAYCAVFGGTVVKDQQGSRFIARDAPAPAGCPVPPAACP